MELRAALPAAAGPAYSILYWHKLDLHVAEGVSYPFLFPHPFRFGREPFGDTRKKQEEGEEG